MTRADKIRQMNDEELAEYLSKIAYNFSVFTLKRWGAYSTSITITEWCKRSFLDKKDYLLKNILQKEIA